MNTKDMKSHLTYPQQLIQAGWKGAHVHQPVADRPESAMARMMLAQAGIGAGLGALSASLRKDRRSLSSVAVGAFVGSLVGLFAGAAWASRHAAGAAARSAIREINLTRDLHWLDKNPIAYG